jgi:hypothetical protein
MIRSSVIAAAAALLFATQPVLAGDSVNRSIQGKLIGEDGKPLAGGEIRADRLDAKMKDAVTTTDRHGQYVFSGLPAGKYAVIAVVDGVPQSRATVQTSPRGWARVDFDLRLNEAGNAGADRMQRDLELRSGTVGK